MALNLQVEERTFLKKLDINFMLVILALNVIGLINVYSATHAARTTITSQLFFNQLVWLAGGWFVFLVATLIDYKVFIKVGIVLYLLNLICLVLVNLFGSIALGARRWLDFGFFKYQPSETMKTALILMMAAYLSKRSSSKGLGTPQLLLPLVAVLLPFISIVIQPDLGTAGMVFLIGMTMILFVGVRTKIIVFAIIAGLIFLPVAWNFGFKDYQKNRILTFLDPGRDPRGAGYNSIQSKIAVGSGQILGKGFRRGSQSQLEFLPEQHTDFIFSVLSEEHGFFGSTITVGLYFLLLVLGVRIASQAREKAGALLAVGILGMIFWHMFINIGMVTGVLPIVGIPLPLISYGGSSMLTTMLGLGLISSVSVRRYIF